MYIDKREIYKEIVISKAQGKRTRKFENMCYLIAKGIANKFSYRTSDDKHDAIQNAMLDMLRFWYNFDPERYSDAFAYFSEIAKRAIVKSYKRMYIPTGSDGEITYSFDNLLNL